MLTQPNDYAGLTPQEKLRFLEIKAEVRAKELLRMVKLTPEELQEHLNGEIRHLTGNFHIFNSYNYRKILELMLRLFEGEMYLGNKVAVLLVGYTQGLIDELDDEVDPN